MKSILLNNKNIEEVAKELSEKNISLTSCLGSFNGIHLGHQVLIKDARIDAKYDLAVISFSNALGEYNIENKDKERLLAPSQKEVLLKKLGVKYNIEIEISKEFLELTPVEFIEKYLQKLNVKEVFVGDDYYFGKDRSGTIELLEKYFKVHRCKIYTFKGNKISTSDIISLLKKGKLELANGLLGYNFEMKGTVVEGLSNGRKIGYPTLNLEPEINYPALSFGVYKVVTYILGIPYVGLANIGVHPTLDKLEKPSIEIHLLNFDRELYGKTIYVEFLNKLRDEKKFNSVEELKAQIEKDISIVEKSHLINRFSKEN